MEDISRNLKFLKVTFAAVASSIATRLTHFEFEHIFVIGLIFIITLAYLDIATTLKITYLIRKKFINKKGSKKKEVDIKDLELDNFKKSSGRSRLMLIPRRIISKIFGLSKFSRIIDKKYLLKIKKFEVKIPLIILWWFKVVSLNVLMLLFLFTTFRRQFTGYPQYKALFPEENEVWNDYTRPIEIEFDIPVDEESLVINMAPQEAEGEWKFERAIPFLPFTRTVKFYPNTTIFPNEKIMVYFTDLTNHFHTRNGGEHLVTFSSISLPTIEKTIPQNKAKEVPVDEEIELVLNQKDGAYVDWEFEFSNKVTFETIRDNSRTVKLQFTDKLKQGKKYTVDIYEVPLASVVETGEVIKRGEREKVKTLVFNTVKAPLVESMSPNSAGILTNATIRVVFEGDMNKESVEKAFSIKPDIAGTISWEDDRTFVFTPDSPLPKETHFDVKFKKGFLSKAGGFSEDDVTFGFDTIGRVAVVGWSPRNGSGGNSIGSSINVTFNQQVDHSSAQSRFSISPNINGSFSWSGNTMIYRPSGNLSYDTHYTVTVSSGVKTVHGLDSTQAFSSSFITESRVFTLNVPLYRQTHAFTCNITATAMALSYKGAASSEMGVYGGIAKDPTACEKSGDTITYWGNPNSGYVGNIDGGGSCGGYGVHWGPVSAYISSRGVSNSVRRGWNVAALAQEVEKGNPSIVWWQNGWASAYWKYWDSPGGRVSALNGMHSEVVVGFIGPSSNPSHIITNDPWRGRRTLTTGQFNALWGWFGNTAVVLY